MADIRITMMGYTKSGKTCYSLGMYNTMQLGIEGFTLLADDTDVMNRLEDQWDALQRGGENRWPFATTQSTDHEFTLSYGLRPIIKFNWYDYRGAAIDYNDAKEDIYGHEVRELSSKINQSDCIFICVSGEHLTRRLMRMDVMAKNIRAPQISRLLSPRVQSYGSVDRPLPIALIVTKWDKCIDARVTEEEIARRLKDHYFSQLFVPGTFTAICPVTLGRDLARNPNKGRISPERMHFPLLFAAYASFRQKLHDQGSLSAEAERLHRLLKAELQGKVRVYLGGNLDG